MGPLPVLCASSMSLWLEQKGQRHEPTLLHQRVRSVWCLQQVFPHPRHLIQQVFTRYVVRVSVRQKVMNISQSIVLCHFCNNCISEFCLNHTCTNNTYTSELSWICCMSELCLNKFKSTSLNHACLSERCACMSEPSLNQTKLTPESGLHHNCITPKLCLCHV